MRDYVPPDIFLRVRAPQPLPRWDIKDQTVHRRGQQPPAATPAAPAATVAPPPARPTARPTARLSARQVAQQVALKAQRETVLAYLATAAPGAGRTTAQVSVRLGLGARSACQVLNHLRHLGAVEGRKLRTRSTPHAPAQSGVEWRLPTALPWPPPPAPWHVPRAVVGERT